MTSIKKLSTALMLGLVLALSSLAFAQNAQTDTSKKESCCSMPSCCCNGDSCPLKKQEKAHAKKHSSGDGCCCCGGDSCETKMKDMKEKEDKPRGN